MAQAGRAGLRRRESDVMRGTTALILPATLGALLGLASPARAHDPALSGIRILYRRHDVVVTVTTSLRRLQMAEGGDGAVLTPERAERAVRRRLTLRFDGSVPIWPKANLILDRACDLLCWQAVVRGPVRTVEALSRLYPEDPTSNTVVTVLRDGQAVEEVVLDSQHPDPRQNRTAAPPVRGLQAAFTASVASRRPTPALVLVGLGMAFLFGAIHALSPGHGKAMAAAALVGTRGTMGHAILLGLVVTLTHTAGVFALGLITLSAAQGIVPERLYPVLSLGSGGLIVCVGATLLAKSLRPYRRERDLEQAWIEEENEDYATPAPTADAKVSLHSLLLLGVTGGAVPCPSALVVMLSAISLHRIAFGLGLILAFSLGLGCVLTGIGLLVVRLGAALERLPWNARLMARLPLVSAAAILLTGVVIVLRAFGGKSF